MKKQYVRIRSFDDLRKSITDGISDYCLLLGGGIAFSVKTIKLAKDGRFRVYHHIDDCRETLSEQQMHERTNIPEGMKKGAFVVDWK